MAREELFSIILGSNLTNLGKVEDVCIFDLAPACVSTLEEGTFLPVHKNTCAMVFIAPFRWLDGWMDGWMGGWMDGWMDIGRLYSQSSYIHIYEYNIEI